MSGTVVNQTRAPVTTGTSTLYTIAARCLVAGTLPDIEIFLFQINDTADPKNDTFIKVVDVADFAKYPTSREDSITSQGYQYRTSTLSLSYNDIVSAIGTQQELDQRITDLTKNFDAYITAFLTPTVGQTLTYPLADTSAKNAAIADYNLSLGAVTAAEEARDTEQISCNAVTLNYQSLQARLADAQRDYTAVGPIKSSTDVLVPIYTFVHPALSAALAAIRVANAASSASAPEKAVIEAQLVLTDAQMASFAGANSTLTSSVQMPLSALLADLQTRVNSLQAQVNAAQLEVNACAAEMAGMQAAVDQARAARDTALAKVRAVCPDFAPPTTGTLPGQLPPFIA